MTTRIQVLTIYVKALALLAKALLLLAESNCNLAVAYMLEACAQCTHFLGLLNATKGIRNLIGQLHYGSEVISSQISQIVRKSEALGTELKTINRTKA